MPFVVTDSVDVSSSVTAPPTVPPPTIPPTPPAIPKEYIYAGLAAIGLAIIGFGVYAATRRKREEERK